MSYDTTVNDAIDPPAARISARKLSEARSLRIAAALSIAITLGALGLVAWVLLR